MKAAFLLLAAALCGWSHAAPPDDEARYLAGLPVPVESELHPLTQESSWQRHAAEFESAWAKLEERQLSKIRTWVANEIGYIQADPSPLYYFFSGPDFLYANAFFPNASTYILCGREPVGKVPAVASLTASQRSSGLNQLRASLNDILYLSFFITKEMQKELNQAHLNGTLPILYIFLARSGCHIQDVELVALDDAGAFVAGDSITPGVRVRFTGTAGQSQTLYFFSSDLSDWGVKKSPGLLTFCRTQGQGNGLLKAASYLMHLDSFSATRQFLLSATRNIIEEDSGIPYRHFKRDEWLVGLYGRYAGPIDLFKNHYQKDLATAFTAQKAPVLPFGIGYQRNHGSSPLIVATALRSIPKAQPAGNE